MTHGTQVASVIAARRDGPVPDEFSQDGFHGVVWGVDLLRMMAVTLGRADPHRNYEGIGAAAVGARVDQLAQWAACE